MSEPAGASPATSASNPGQLDPPGPSSAPGHRDRNGRLLVLGLYLALALGFNVIVPVFEAPDESFHFFFAQHLAYDGQLPVQPADPDARGPWEQEGSQPPLYYAAVAPVIESVGDRLEPEALRYNHQNTMGHPAVVGNENRFVHPDSEAWPWTGHVLAVHLVRLVSSVLGAVAVMGVFAVGDLAFPGRPRLATASGAVAGLSPQFLATMSAVTNDALIVPLATWALVALLSLIVRDRALSQRERETPRSSPPWVLVLAVTAGLAPLVKLSGLAVLGFATLVGTVWASRHRAPIRWLRRIGPALVTFLVACGWWYWRNLALYGDVTGINRMLPGDTGRDFRLTDWLAGLTAELVGLWRSLWGVFGWFTVMLPDWAYAVIDLAVLVAAAGLVVLIVRGVASAADQAGLERLGGRDAQLTDQRDPGGHGEPDGGEVARPAWLDSSVVILLAAWLAVVFVSLLRWMTLAKGAHGRLLLPAAAALAVLLVAGWRAALPRRLSDTAVAASVVAGMSALSAGALFGVIRPAYAAPEGVTDVPASAHAVGVEFGDGLLLQAADIPERVTAGEPLALTLFWQTERDVQRDGYVAVRLERWARAPNREPYLMPTVSKLSYPGRGSLPPGLMVPGRTYPDRWRLDPDRTPALDPVAAADLALPQTGSVDRPSVLSQSRLPALARLAIHVYDMQATERWPATRDGSRLPAEEWSTELVIAPQSPLKVPENAPVMARFDNGLVAHGPYRVPSGAASPHLAVLWRAEQSPETDLSAFVHLASTSDPSGPAVQETFDRPVSTLSVLPTARWRAGDVVLALYPYALPEPDASNGWLLLWGLYTPDGERVSGVDATGQPLPDHALELPLASGGMPAGATEWTP